MWTLEVSNANMEHQVICTKFEIKVVNCIARFTCDSTAFILHMVRYTDRMNIPQSIPRLEIYRETGADRQITFVQFGPLITSCSRPIIITVTVIVTVSDVVNL